MEEKNENTIEGFSILEGLGTHKHANLYRVEHDKKEAILAIFHKKYAKKSQFVGALEKLEVLYKQIEHPAMLKVYQWHYDKEKTWVLMETCDQKLIMEESRMKKERFALMKQLSSLIDEAHQKQFHHGGLSPDVLFIRNDGSLCVGGWGSYFFDSFSVNDTYLAPEEKKASRVSDLYAVGLLSYQILSGKLPWEEKCSRIEIQERKRKQELRPLTAFGFTEELSEVMNRALSNYPVNRFDKAEQIFEAMRHPPRNVKTKIKKQAPPTIDIEKAEGFRWRREVKLFVPLLVLFFLFAISAYYFVQDPPQQTGKKINMRFKGKSQQTKNKASKSNRIVVGGIYFDFVEIPTGEQVLGPRKRDGQARPVEKSYTMEVNQSFLITQTEISTAQWNEVMEVDKEGGAYPKSGITWLEAVQFCNRLSEKMGKPEVYVIDGESVRWKKGSRGYRLPTNAEWEYAARGKEDYIFAGSDEANDVSWNITNSQGVVHQVASKKSNAFFLHDMSGNLAEWAWDCEPCKELEKCTYTPPTMVNPSYRGVQSGTRRGIRGGSALDGRAQGRLSARTSMVPTESSESVGFRIIY